MTGLSKREEAVAHRVKQARLRAQLTQAAIGEHLGLSEVGYGHYDRARQPFSIDQLFKLSSILGRSVQHFLGIDNGLTPDEDELLARYRALPPAQARWFLDSLRGAMSGQHE